MALSGLPMSNGAIEVLESLEDFTLELDSEYYSDSERVALGKAEALLSHLHLLGFSDLAERFSTVPIEEGNVIRVLEFVRGFLGPEMRRRLLEIEEGAKPSPEFWNDIHPRIKSVARSRFESGHFADAVESALKEVNAVVKEYVLDRTQEELDGAKLMNKAFSLQNPVIGLDDLGRETGRNIQQGYMQIFAGTMLAIRNPKAHNNIVIDRSRAIHFLYLASLLMGKYDERLKDATN